MLDLEKLVDEESDYLFRFALRHFSKEDIAEELVQETFLAAVQAKDRFEGTATPRTWLTSILRHKIIDRIRRKSKDQTVPLDQIPGMGIEQFFDEVEHWKAESGPLPLTTSPDTLFEQKEFLETLQTCMQKLPDRLRELFIMREVDGFEQEELCELYQVSATNLRVMLHRIRVHMRDCIQVKWL